MKKNVITHKMVDISVCAKDDLHQKNNLIHTMVVGEFHVKITIKFIAIKMRLNRTSLVAQWLGILMPMQRTQVRALVQEDPTCHGATKPTSHNY